jgi:hypothetical protein
MEIYKLISWFNPVDFNISFSKFFIEFFELNIEFSDILISDIIDIKVIINFANKKIILKALFLFKIFSNFLIDGRKKIKSFKVLKAFIRDTFFEYA